MKNFNRSSSLFLIFPLLFYTTVIIIITTGNGGIFTYTIDDAYIHLELARNIAGGNYGLNPEEIASPSSSIIWPFLLAPFSGVPGYQNIPLILNILFSLSTVFILGIIIASVFPGIRKLTAFLLVTSLSFFLNLYSLPFTGMEHCLQIFLVTLTFHELISSGTKRRSNLLIILAALLPLVRYENFLITGAIIFYFIFNTCYRKAVVSFGISLLIPAIFSIVLASSGLPVLPGSIMVKTGLNTTFIGNVLLSNITAGFGSKFGIFILPVHLFLLLFFIFVSIKMEGMKKYLSISAAFVVTGHLLIGKYGGFGRYEPYVNVFSILSFIFINEGNLATPGRRNILTVVIFIFSLPYLAATYLTPLAARNIFQQHYSMHRFLTEFYKHAAAANDIGLASFQNDKYLLDLFGLSDNKITPLLVAREPGKIDSIIGTKKIRVIMIYENWYTALPDKWIKLAEMKIASPVAFIGKKISFFASAEDVVPDLMQALEIFANRLPEGVEMHFIYGKGVM